MSESAHTIRLSVAGLSCAGCVATVENALKNTPGVHDASVNFAEHTASISGSADARTVIAAVIAVAADDLTVVLTGIAY